jgi:hypothetical protein
VNTLEELQSLPRDRDVNGFRRRQSIRLEIPAVTRQVLVRAQVSLNELQERCGSRGAASFMFVTLLYGVIQVFHRNVSLLTLSAAIEFAAVLVVSFAAGALGKYVALAITRLQFAHRCRVHHRTLSLKFPPPPR